MEVVFTIVTIFMIAVFLYSMKENFHELNKTSSLKLSELPKLNKEITYVKLKYEVAESTIQQLLFE